MPLYEYRCPQCGEVFERLRRSSDADEKLPCPRCSALESERLISSFAATGCGGGAGRRGFR